MGDSWPHSEGFWSQGQTNAQSSLRKGLSVLPQASAHGTFSSPEEGPFGQFPDERQTRTQPRNKEKPAWRTGGIARACSLGGRGGGGQRGPAVSFSLRRGLSWGGVLEQAGDGVREQAARSPWAPRARRGSLWATIGEKEQGLEEPQQPSQETGSCWDGRFGREVWADPGPQLCCCPGGQLPVGRPLGGHPARGTQQGQGRAGGRPQGGAGKAGPADGRPGRGRPDQSGLWGPQPVLAGCGRAGHSWEAALRSRQCSVSRVHEAACHTKATRRLGDASSGLWVTG